ncbi:hypothetical protein [Streptosporangium sp. NPDC004631]
MVNMNDDPGRLPFLGKQPPSAFELRRIVLAPGFSADYDESEWRDAIVVVEQGEFEAEGLDGRRRRFGRGDVLWLADLPLRALRNPGRAAAVLVAVSRRHRDPDAGLPGAPPPRLAGEHQGLR